MRMQIDEKQMLEILNTLYDKALDGIPKVSQSVDEMVDHYLSRHNSIDKAADLVYTVLIESRMKRDYNEEQDLSTCSGRLLGLA